MVNTQSAQRSAAHPGRSPGRNRVIAGVGASVMVAAGIAATTTSPARATGNLASNPGFENGLSGWSCASGSGSAVGGPVHGGSGALKATPAGSDNAKCTQTVGVLPNSRYTLSAWVQGSYVYLGASGTGTADASTWTPSASTYQKLSTGFTTGPDTTSVTIYTHGWYGQPAYFADDVDLSGPGGGVDPTPTPTPTSSPTPTPTPTATDPGDGGDGDWDGPVPKHALTGYWQNFDNGATVQTIAQVQDEYDIIAVSFADATATPGTVDFTVDPALGYSESRFKADVKAKQAQGKKVILSVGGERGAVSVASSAAAANFAESLYAQMREYGFDGVDIDLENGLNSTYMTQALRALSAKAGAGLVITMAPQTIDMQSTSNEYFRTALAVKDILTVVNMQYYNSGSMLGCDGKVYSQGSVDFLTALACIQLEGGLAPSQVGLGLPASTRGAGSGYVSPTIVNNAMDCLTEGVHCGSFKPSKTYPGLRGAMTWSTNWDASNGDAFSGTVGPHLDTLP